MSAPTRRVQRGRGHSYFLDGEPVPGVTTILSRGVPKHLEDWVARTTAGYACDHWAELAELGTAERMRRLIGSRFETLKRASKRGTDLHRLAELLAAGEECDVAEELTGLVDACVAFLEEWRVVPILTEATVISRRWRYMGTLDLIATLADGRTWLLDWKTGASGVFPEAALQLSAYAHAETYLTADGEEQVLPDIDACGAVHLRDDGTYSLIPLAADDDTFRTFLYACQVAQFTDAPRELYVLEELPPPPRLEAVSE